MLFLHASFLARNHYVIEPYRSIHGEILESEYYLKLIVLIARKLYSNSKNVKKRLL